MGTSESAELRDRLREQLARVPTPVVAVTCYVGGRPWGVTASSFTSVSLDPPVVSVCVFTRSPIIAPIRLQARLAISILSAQQAHIARTLALPGTPKFIETMAPEADQFSEWTETIPIGTVRYEQADGHSPLAPRIYGALAVLQCTLRQALEVGDHTLLLGDVCSLETNGDQPALVYANRRFSHVDQNMALP
jgi:flavin reductase (DIM6/NTAB) family NADH-FMN oxidoreductase RutF